MESTFSSLKRFLSPQCLGLRSVRKKMASFYLNPRTLFLFLVIFFALSMASSLPRSSGDSPVTPTTPLLSFLIKLQSAALQTYGSSKFDPKLYVDLPLKVDLSTVEQALDKLPKSANGSITVSDLEGFLDRYMGEAGTDLVTANPPDFVAEPSGFLPLVKNDVVRKWALEVHSLWNNLSRKVSDEVKKNTSLHTLLPLPGAVVVPGSRFREVYYWDSYWVIRGLLASKMHETAKSIVNNLLSLLDEYGHVLNGARVYYTNRSQPPLLSSMILEIYKKTGDLALVKRAFPSLRKEHQFWISGIHNLTIQDAHGYTHSMSRYFARWNQPRPESATTDEETASSLSTASEKDHLYRELASTAESGWDFSTRWMSNHSDLTTLATTSILPVDLNAYVLKMELDLAFFAKILGDKSAADMFSALSKSRKEGIDAIFWNAKKGQWFDYWTSKNTTSQGVHKWEESNQNQNIFASNFIPLWIELFHSDRSRVEKVMKSFRSSGLLQPAGIATSLTNSGQQWDFPNGWAPLQHMIVEGLARSGLREARLLAEDIATKWIKTNYATYKKTGDMHEKFDVQGCGQFGGGGEYVPQTGFGWSNGVVLAFLEEFGWPQDRRIAC
ncbi:probable trehalase [Aristolochia californica]|uniref:probable trehalase n=1 Tax=Aristolochia californica TaxID=171875 RepID=UPI0035DE102A